MKQWIFSFVAPLLLLPAPGLASFDYESLVRIIAAKRLNRLEDALREIPPIYWRRYALVYDGESLQDASPKDPRVILFGRDAKLTISFNGDPAQDGSDRLEFIVYRDKTRSFELRDITFPTKKNRLEKVEYSTANPKACMGCHMDNVRPNWDPYPTWTGMYGSDDDTMAGEELRGYHGFMSRAGKHPRYHLLKPIAGSPIAPYSPERMGAIPFRPNLLLTKLFARLNAKRLAGWVERSPYRRLYGPLIPFLQLECQFPGDPKRRDIEKRVRRFVQREVVATRGKITALATDTLFVLTLKALGITPDDYRLEFMIPFPSKEFPESYAYNDGLFQMNDLFARAVYEDLAKGDRELTRLYRKEGYATRRSPSSNAEAEVMRDVDALGGALDRKMADRACPLLLSRIKIELGRRP